MGDIKYVKFDKHVELSEGDSYTLGLFSRASQEHPEVRLYLHTKDTFNTAEDEGVAVVFTVSQLHVFIDNANELLRKVQDDNSRTV